MWTFLDDFLKNGDLNLKICTFDMDLDLKNADLYTWFSEKLRPQLKNEDLYAWFSEKFGP